ncbi:hypothetical protein GCM10027060_19230 [Nesterenkonia halophila]
MIRTPQGATRDPDHQAGWYVAGRAPAGRAERHSVTTMSSTRVKLRASICTELSSMRSLVTTG